MKFKQILIVFLGLSLMVGTLAMSQQTLAAKSGAQNFDGICTAADRGVRACTREIYQGCLCYNNRTCINTGINKCSDCSRSDVFSATKGACPKIQEGLCAPIDPAVDYVCTQDLYQACVCTKDGKCSVKMANKCKTCHTPTGLAVFEGNKCPASNLQAAPSSTNSSEITCTPESRNNDRVCAAVVLQEGCAVLKDGTTKTVSVNACTCQDTNIVKYTPGKKCPAPAKTFVPKKCPNYNGALVKCSSVPDAGCACYKNGTCSYRTDGNTCSLCAVTGTKVVSFNPGEKCPLKSAPVKKQCNTADAHKCTTTDKSAQFCNYLAALQTCVCYNDGTCKTVSGTNQCLQCKRTDVVSVAQGKPCPAKC